MVETLVGFAGIALLVSVTPGPATALVVRSAATGGRREAMLTTLGNSTGILMWALASVLGISALVAASEAAFVALKVVGAAVLVWLGVQALRGRGAERDAADPARAARSAYGRARRAVVGSALARRVERVTGGVMIGLGVRVALERR